VVAGAADTARDIAARTTAKNTFFIEYRSGIELSDALATPLQSQFIYPCQLFRTLGIFSALR
jgi:hypothetical protein